MKIQGRGSNSLPNEFSQLDGALTEVGFSNSQKEVFYCLLSAILHIGNLFFALKTAINN